MHAVGGHAHLLHVGAPLVDEAARGDQLGDRVAWVGKADKPDLAD